MKQWQMIPSLMDTRTCRDYMLFAYGGEKNRTLILMTIVPLPLLTWVVDEDSPVKKYDLDECR